jgi:ferredoxin-NADP reductase
MKAYICGPTAFVEAAAGLLQGTGVPAGQIKTERFGASG